MYMPQGMALRTDTEEKRFAARWGSFAPKIQFDLLKAVLVGGVVDLRGQNRFSRWPQLVTAQLTQLVLYNMVGVSAETGIYI